MREFSTGATRDSDTQKLDYEGFLSPLALRAYAQYLHKHRTQPDGTQRASDNWQKGIPRSVYMKSGFRHLITWWENHREVDTAETIEDSICGVIFNAFGYLHELEKEKAERP